MNKEELLMPMEQLNAKTLLMKQLRTLCHKVWLDPDINLVLDLQQTINKIVDTLELERV